jgi:hypothetical protein
LDFSDARQAAAGHSFDSIVIVAGMVPFFVTVLVLLLVRKTRRPMRAWSAGFDEWDSASFSFGRLKQWYTLAIKPQCAD